MACSASLKQITLGMAKYPTAVTTSQHTFGSFTRTFYEFEYTKNGTTEVHKFRGSMIDFCLHGHNWLTCCTPVQVVPEQTEPSVPPATKTPEPARDPEPSPNTSELKTPNLESASDPVETNKNGSLGPGFSATNSSEPPTDPQDLIQSAPLFNHYMARLLNHSSTEKYDVDLNLLLPGSKRPRKKTTPPRPPNSFLVYSMYVKDLEATKPQTSPQSRTPKRTGPQVHIDLGRRWRLLPNKDKEFFSILADFAKHLHSIIYPNYVYTPERKKKK